MKTRLKMTLLAVAATATMLAQTPFGVVSASATDPATEVANHVARLTRLLTLTTTQVTQATTIFTNALTAVSPLQTTLSTDRTNLTAAIKTNSTSTIDSLAANIGMVTGQIVAIQNKADAAFYTILTTAQQATLDAAGGFNGHGDGPGRGPGAH